MDLILRQMKDGVFGADIEITRDLVADYLSEQWHRMSSRNVLPKRNKMEFAINLQRFSRVRDEEGGIVIVRILLIDRPQQNIGCRRRRKFCDEAIALLV